MEQGCDLSVVIFSFPISRWLLEHGCDPSVGDTDKVMPYDVASDKDTRNQFRRFMAQHPDKFDYKKVVILDSKCYT